MQLVLQRVLFIWSLITWCNCTCLTFITIGMGSVGKRITKLALNNGLECVGGLTRTSNLGLDIGTVIGIDQIEINITTSNTLTELLLNTKPNIIFDSTSTTNSIDENYDLFKSILSLSTDENNPNGEYFNIITVEMGFYYPWKTFSELSSKYTNITKINELHSLSKSKKIGIIGTGVQDLFFHSILPLLLPLVPDFNTIKISLSLNLNHPYYAQYVSGADINSDNSCESFISNYCPQAAEQIVYRVMIDILGMDLNNAMIELNECQTLFNYDEKVLCVGCGDTNDVQYYIEPGKSIGSNSTFTVIIDDLVISVSFIAAVYNSFDALSTYYHIIGPYNYQSVSFDHVDDFLVTAQSAIQRINDVMNGKGIITDNLPFIQFYNGENNYKSRVVHSLKDVDKKEL
eukprot:397986_1